MKTSMRAVAVSLAAISFAGGVGVAEVNIETVVVGNPGNAGEWSGESYGGSGPDGIVGAVDYVYRIGKYEVTTGQYTEFLNAVAGTDAYGLYNTYMVTSLAGMGCRIERFAGSGTSGDPYQYRVDANRANRPVNYVGWGDVARFANWLHNGQPTGAQDLSTTEDGAYFLDGAITDLALSTMNRKADAKWALPTEDEWYKAAYYNPATSSYHDFPTGSDSLPGRDMAEATNPGNNATHYGNPHPIDSPHYTTVVGEFELSASPYGTFDQGGNVWERNETIFPGWARRGIRGGSFAGNGYYMHAGFRYVTTPTHEASIYGFRVVEVPDPASASVLLLGAIALSRRRKK